jgi:hypothetical protein
MKAVLQPLDVLEARYATLKRRLDSLETTITRGARKFDWAKGAFGRRIKQMRQSFPRRLSEPSTADWASLLALESACDGLFSESLAFVNRIGVSAIEPQLGDLAVSVVAETARACGLAEPPLIVPDLSDSYSDFVPMIRLRFPPDGLWDVPVLAHELGHHVAYRLSADAGYGLERRRPMVDLISARMKAAGGDERQKSKVEHWLNEFFADMFATYVLGFSFAASVLMLRLDLSSPNNAASATHPSPAARAKAILYAMKRMSKDMADGAKDRPFDAPRSWLEARWKALVGAEAPGDPGAGLTELPFAELYDAICSMAPDALYRGWDKVPKLQNDLQGKAAPWPADARDLLNAAWSARTEGDKVDDIEQRTLLWRVDAGAKV